MTDQEQALRLILAEWYAKKKGWKKIIGDVFISQVGVRVGRVPDLIDPRWLFKLVEMLNIQHIIIDPTVEGTWVCGISIDSREWFKAIANTRELAIAKCLGKIIKEEV